MALKETLPKAGDGDVLRSLAGTVLQILTEFQRDVILTRRAFTKARQALKFAGC